MVVIEQKNRKPQRSSLMKKYVKYLPFLPAAIGVLALIMIFLPAIGITGAEKTYNGVKAIFGSLKIAFPSVY